MSQIKILPLKINLKLISIRRREIIYSFFQKFHAIPETGEEKQKQKQKKKNEKERKKNVQQIFDAEKKKKAERYTNFAWKTKGKREEKGGGIENMFARKLNFYRCRDKAIPFKKMDEHSSGEKNLPRAKIFPQ